MVNILWTYLSFEFHDVSAERCVKMREFVSHLVFRPCPPISFLRITLSSVSVSAVVVVQLATRSVHTANVLCSKPGACKLLYFFYVFPFCSFCLFFCSGSCFWLPSVAFLVFSAKLQSFSQVPISFRDCDFDAIRLTASDGSILNH